MTKPDLNRSLKQEWSGTKFRSDKLEKPEEKNETEQNNAIEK